MTTGGARRFFARLGLARPGFLTPYRYLDGIEHAVTDYGAIRALFETRRADFSAFLGLIDGHGHHFAAMAQGEHCPDWRSAFISPFDGATIYTGIAAFRPRKVIEIGSGNSTVFMVRAAADHGTGTAFTCIDPAPRIDITGLPVTFIRRTLSHEDVALAATLQPGDVLFVDSSHILQQGFDLDIILNRILPALQAGVIVHFHDIFLPYGYPPQWEKFRFNEQQALVGWLVSGYLVPIFSAQFAIRDMGDAVAGICPGWPMIAASGGASLWLRKA